MPTFLDTYLEAVGVSEVPRVYHTWSSLSVLAAHLGDHVWVCKTPGKPLYPNLYILLIGTSGSGKDEALDFASDLCDENILDPWSGKLSGAGFADVIAQRSASTTNGYHPNIYLVTPELSHSLMDRRTASAFIKMMTALYGVSKRKYREAIRSQITMKGDILEAAPPVLNWGAGSAMPWLLHSLDPSDIQSGFCARALTIIGEKDRSVRHTDPQVPPNRPALVTALRKHLAHAARLQGEIVLSPEARSIRAHWYQSRPLPSDERLHPSWDRADDQVLKVCQVLSAASGRWDMRVTGPEMTKAQRLVAQAHRNIEALLAYASQTALTSDTEIVASIIRKAERMPHAALLKRVTKRGMHARDLALHLETLVGRKDVALSRVEGTRMYTWIGG